MECRWGILNMHDPPVSCRLRGSRCMQNERAHEQQISSACNNSDLVQPRSLMRYFVIAEDAESMRGCDDAKWTVLTVAIIKMNTGCQHLIENALRGLHMD